MSSEKSDQVKVSSKCWCSHDDHAAFITSLP